MSRRSKRQERLNKAAATLVAQGGSASPIHPGVAQGRVPSGNNQRIANSHSKYNELAGEQPPNLIQDLDIDGNWFSPFQPITPFGPPNVRYPRRFDYPTGWNLNYIPQRQAIFQQLRAMSRSWGILRTVIETRKDQFMRVPYGFRIKDKPREKNHPRIKELTEFFRKPDGKSTFHAWTRKLLEDMLVIDAPALYFWRSRGGKPLAIEVLDGATIKPLVDDAGRIPDYPSPAYQQIIKGLPMVDFDETELLYAPMRPTSEFPVYGYSPVEQIYLEVVAGIKRLVYQVSFWTEGSMPELIVTVPEGWTPQQVALFQAHFDAIMAGNVEMKSKVRFVPTGMKPFDIKNANGEALKADIDEWQARLVCFAFSINPMPFVRMMNRATGETVQQASEEEGLLPLMRWFKEDIMDIIVQEHFGYDDMEFAYLPNPEVDQVKQSTVLTSYVDGGIISVNEARNRLSLDPVHGGDELMVMTPNGPVPLIDSLEAARANAKHVVENPGGDDSRVTADVAQSPKPRGPKKTGNEDRPPSSKKSLFEGVE